MNINSTVLPWVANFIILLIYKTDLNSYTLSDGQVNALKKYILSKTATLMGYILNKKWVAKDLLN